MSVGDEELKSVERAGIMDSRKMAVSRLRRLRHFSTRSEEVGGQGDGVSNEMETAL